MLNLNAENFHRLCPALEKGTIYLPKMQQFSWVTEMHLGEGSKKKTPMNKQTVVGEEETMALGIHAYGFK